MLWCTALDALFLIKFLLEGATVIFFAILLKALVWVIAFRAAMRKEARGMLLYAAGIALILTVIDSLSVASNLRLSALLLTLSLYLLMSFVLIPSAWKLRKPLLSLLLNLAGMLGALAGVNFTMDLLRGLVPFLNR